MNAPRLDSDREVIALLESSAIVSAINRLRSAIADAANTSAAARFGRRIVTAFRGCPQSRRRQLTAVALGTAIAVHLLLILWRGARTDFLWLLVPAIVGVMTVVIAIMASDPGRHPS
jgi:hypothetical protein